MWRYPQSFLKCIVFCDWYLGKQQLVLLVATCPTCSSHESIIKWVREEWAIELFEIKHHSRGNYVRVQTFEHQVGFFWTLYTILQKPHIECLDIYVTLFRDTNRWESTPCVYNLFNYLHINCLLHINSVTSCETQRALKPQGKFVW